jgi:hypothetical protein
MRRWHREEWIWSFCARGVVAAAAVLALNLLMFVLAAMGSSPMEAPFLVAWITGDAALFVALFLTERP